MKWKGRKQRRRDKIILDALIKSIGLPPTHAVYNYEKQYFEVTWRRSDNPEEYFLMKAGEALFVQDGNTRRLSVWCRFAHPESVNRGVIQFTIYDVTDAIQLVRECRQAILMLRAEMIP